MLLEVLPASGLRELLVLQALLLDQFKVGVDTFEIFATMTYLSVIDSIGTGVNCKHNSRWTNTRTYKTGSKVVFKGSVYIASSLNLVSFLSYVECMYSELRSLIERIA